MWRLLPFLVWPLAEIALFVVIGGRIGLLATLLIILGTGVAGAFLLRSELVRGAQLMRQLATGQVDPDDRQAGAGVFRGLAGIALILPGFLTDMLGLLLLVPPVQRLLARALSARVQVAGGAVRSAPMDEDVIEGEWVEVPQQARRQPPSRWVQNDDPPRDSHGH